MKKFLPLFIVLLSIGQAFAQQSQLLINENFTGYTDGNLNTTSPGQGSPYKWTPASSYFSSDFVKVAKTTPLIYPGYQSGSQYVNLVPKDDYTVGFWPQYPDDPTKGFLGGTNVSLTGNTTFYVSFVIRVPNASGISTTGSATQTLSLRSSGGDELANFYVAKHNGNNNLQFGIDKTGGSTSSDYTANASTYTYNTTHLVVMRYDIVSGSSNDKLYLWVDPSSIASEPSTSSALVSITSGSDNYSGSVSIGDLQLFQDDNSATVSIDAIKVAYAKSFSTVAATSAAAWNALSPVGTPLPVKFGDLKAYSKDKGVAIDWDVYSEINVDHYEIERSADGVNFFSIGKVTAKGLDGKLLYNFNDATPLDGNNYYRIKNVDIDANSSFSSIVRVNLSATSAAGVLVYPNPVTDKHVSVQLTNLQKGDYAIELFNTGGQTVYTKQFTHPGGTINQTLTLPSTLQRGIYTIRVAGSGFKQAKSILIQ